MVFGKIRVAKKCNLKVETELSLEGSMNLLHASECMWTIEKADH